MLRLSLPLRTSTVITTPSFRETFCPICFQLPENETHITHETGESEGGLHTHTQLIRKTTVQSQFQATDAVSPCHGDEHQLCAVISHIHQVCRLARGAHRVRSHLYPAGLVTLCYDRWGDEAPAPDYRTHGNFASHLLSCNEAVNEPIVISEVVQERTLGVQI